MSEQTLSILTEIKKGTEELEENVCYFSRIKPKFKKSCSKGGPIKIIVKFLVFCMNQSSPKYIMLYY